MIQSTVKISNNKSFKGLHGICLENFEALKRKKLKLLDFHKTEINILIFHIENKFRKYCKSVKYDTWTKKMSNKS